MSVFLGVVAATLALAAWAFVTAFVGRFLLGFCADRAERWWAFPLWMAAGMPIFLGGAAGALFFVVFGFCLGSGREFPRL